MEIRNKEGITLPVISPNRKLENLHKKIKDTLEIRTFFEMIDEDKDALRLLTNHYSTLSPFEKFNLPLLFSISSTANLPFEIMAKKETAKAEHTIERIVEKSKPKIEELIDKFKLRFGLLFKELEAEGEIIQIEEEREQQILSMIISQIIIREIGDEERILKILKMFEDFVIDDVVAVGFSFIDSMKNEILIIGNEHKVKSLRASNIKDSGYENIIKKLISDFKIIKPLLSIYWCENKNHEHFSFYMTSHSINPTIKCPICNKKLSNGTFYYFVPQVNYLLRQKEGLIYSLIMWTLDKSALPWNHSLYLDGESKDLEKDFIVEIDENEYCLIEVKSFATDVPERTKKSNIKNCLTQLLKQIDSYEGKGISICKVILVTNYSKDSKLDKIVNELASSKKYGRIKQYDFELIGWNNLIEFKNLFPREVEG